MKLNTSKITEYLYHKRAYILAFLIPAVLMYIVYSAFGVFPFGDNSVLVLDLNGQYVYYYQAMRDAFWGDGSMLYSWSRILGGEMTGIFAYYLASPFSIIPMLFPRDMLLEGILVMQLVKMGACGVTFAFYLKNSKKHGDYNIIIFSTLYAMMSYAVVQLMDPMWIDGLVYLPLIIYGVEKLIDEGKKLQFIIPLALMFIANYYIGWMVGFFTFLYFVYYIFFGKKDDSSTTKEKLRIFLRFCIGTAVAIMCAAIIIIPVYYSLKLGKLEFSTPSFDLKPQFTLFDFFTKLLPNTYDTVRNEGLPFVYCGTLTLFMVPLYFANHNIEGRKKLGNGLLLATVLLSMYLSTIDLAWHGFQVPNWLPYRYSFVFSFVMLVMASEAFERIEGVSLKNIGATFGGLLLYILYVDTLKKPHLETTGAIWFSLVCISGFALLISYYKKNQNVKTIPLVFVILIVGELFSVNLETIKAINTDVTYSKHSSYVSYAQDGYDLMKKLEAQDNSFYRTEKTFHRTVNDPMAFQMKGLSHSSSALNAGPIKLLDSLGYSSRGHYIKYKGDTLLTDDLFGIKYLINKDKPVYYNEVALEHEGMTVYKNPNAMSVGYMVNSGIKDLTLEKDNPFVNQNKLLSAMLTDEYVEYFKPITVNDTITTNVTESKYSGHDLYTKVIADQNAQVEFRMESPTSDVIYMYLPSSWENKVAIWVNSQFLDDYYETENYSIKTLGRFNENEALSVIATLSKEKVYIKDKWFYYLDESMLDTAIANLKPGEWNITEYSDSYLKGDVTAAADQMLFTTIPYEPGWTIKVDGVKTEPVKLVGGLIGIDVSEGEHEITMSFFPKGLPIGIIISGIGILLLIGIAIIEKKNRKVLLKRLYS